MLSPAPRLGRTFKCSHFIGATLGSDRGQGPHKQPQKHSSEWPSHSLSISMPAFSVKNSTSPCQARLHHIWWVPFMPLETLPELHRL